MLTKVITIMPATELNRQPTPKAIITRVVHTIVLLPIR